MLTLFPDNAGLAVIPLKELDDLLRAQYGQPQRREIWDPLTQLIYSLCAPRTKTEVSHAALRALRDRYDGWPNERGDVHWEKLRDASADEIAETITMCTFPEPKARAIKNVLVEIHARTGALPLEFLRSYRTEKIRAWLEQFPGVGSFVTAEVINFSLRRPLLVIDGHHQRVAIRLGYSPKGSSAKRVEDDLMRLVPGSWGGDECDDHHMLVKVHGQTVCKTGEPICGRCVVRTKCPVGRGECTP